MRADLERLRRQFVLAVRFERRGRIPVRTALLASFLDLVEAVDSGDAEAVTRARAALTACLDVTVSPEVQRAADALGASSVEPLSIGGADVTASPAPEGSKP